MMGYTNIGLTTTSSELFQADTKSCRDISRLFKEWLSCSWWLSQWAWSCVDESQSSITNYYTSEFLPSKEFPLSGQCVSTHKHSHPSTCAVVKQDMKWQNEMKQWKELKQDVTIKTLTMTSQDGGQVVKALDYRPRGPRFQPHYNNRDFFHLGVY